MIDGAGDHFVSEALYLSDPEGNGIEIYRDRPRDTWEYNRDGTLIMGTAAVDLPAVIEAANPAPWAGRGVYGGLAAAGCVRYQSIIIVNPCSKVY